MDVKCPLGHLSSVCFIINKQIQYIRNHCLHYYCRPHLDNHYSVESIDQENQHLNHYQSIILELSSSFTCTNALQYIIILLLASDGMSSSNSIINHYYPISLYLYTRNCVHVLRVELEKGDLINQLSSSFILFIIISFDSVVSSSPYRASSPRMMDSSRIRSHSSFIQSFILSNSIR